MIWNFLTGLVSYTVIYIYTFFIVCQVNKLCVLFFPNMFCSS
jgi:hypothetical protein